jgi:hypothetical protein
MFDNKAHAVQRIPYDRPSPLMIEANERTETSQLYRLANGRCPMCVEMASPSSRALIQFVII